MGNWKQFTNILDKRSLNLKHSIYLGTHGVVRVPVNGNTYQEFVFDTISSTTGDRKWRNIPEYIWSYIHLQSNASTHSEDFVAIGYNSPYFGVRDI